MEQVVKLTEDEKLRVNRICKALLHDRRIWSRKFKKWLSGPREDRPDHMWSSLDRLKPFEDELLCLLRKVNPQTTVSHISTLVDLYAYEHKMRWDGELLEDGDEIWIGLPDQKGFKWTSTQKTEKRSGAKSATE